MARDNDLIWSFKGDNKETRVTSDPDAWSSDRALDLITIVPAWLGFSQLTPYLRGPGNHPDGYPDEHLVGDVAGAMLKSDRGAYVALLERPDEVPNIVLIQHDASRFYQEQFGPRSHLSRIWRNFYFRSIFVALRQADELWRPEKVAVTSLSGNQWRYDSLAVVLEVAAYLRLQDRFGIEEIEVLGCDEGIIERALDETQKEREGVSVENLRPVTYEDESFESAFGQHLAHPASEISGTLLHVPVEREGLAGHQEPFPGLSN